MNETPVTAGAWPGGRERRRRLARGGRADPAPLDRGARHVRGRVLPHRSRDDLRPARAAGADLHRRVRPARRQARRPARRRLHLHQRQAARAVRRAPRQPRGGRARRRPRSRRAAADDRDQGVLRPRPRVRRGGVRLVGGARALAARRSPASRTRSRWSGSPTPTASGRARGSSSPTTPTRSSSGSRPYVELGFDELIFHAPGDDQARFLEQFARDVLPRLRAAH